MKTSFAALFALCALIGMTVNAEETAAPAEAAAPVVAASPDAGVDIVKQIEEAKAKAKEIEKSLAPFRQKVAGEAIVKEAKAKMEEAKKAFDDAQRQALTAIPEAAEILTKLDEVKATEKGLVEKKMAEDKAAKEKKMAEDKAAKSKKVADEKAAKAKN